MVSFTNQCREKFIPLAVTHQHKYKDTFQGFLGISDIIWDFSSFKRHYKVIRSNEEITVPLAVTPALKDGRTFFSPGI